MLERKEFYEKQLKENVGADVQRMLGCVERTVKVYYKGGKAMIASNNPKLSRSDTIQLHRESIYALNALEDELTSRGWRVQKTTGDNTETWYIW